jgi:hypothetical protein
MPTSKHLITDHLDPHFVPFGCSLCGGEADCEEHMENNIDFGRYKSVEQAEYLAEQTELWHGLKRTAKRLASELMEKQR